MSISFETFCSNADSVRDKITTACASAGRTSSEVELLAVTKNHGAWAPIYAARYGLQGVGENRVQEAVDKKPEVIVPLRWELIGHLQSNKAAIAAAQFDRVQSVDSVKLLNRLNRAAEENGQPLSILLQINAGQDPAKFGADVAVAPALLEHALQQPHLRVDGLMTIAPLAEDPDVATRTFTTLRNLRDQLATQFATPLTTLSMGMSGDLSAAIAAGSTQVRIGTALFGQRFRP